MDFLHFLLLCWVVSAVAMGLVWAMAMRVRNVGYVDVAWAALLALCALLAGAFAPGSEVARALVAFFGSIWGARLSLHLLARVLHEPEDGRYVALRERWNGSPARFFVFFQMQALVVVLFCVPFYAAAANPGDASLGWLLAALACWLAAVGGESLADRQLAAFRADPDNRGHTCRSGLWAWSRHPNYFFEWLHWFTYVLLSIGSPWLAWSLVGPAVMLLFLYRVSGIPWTEAQSLRSRGEDYRQYQREVSAFVPLPPRRGDT